MGVTFGISLLSCIEDEILRYFICTSLPAMAAIIDSPLTLMSESVYTRITKLLDPENVGVAYGILLPSRV